ncbi:MAG: glycosyltransferase family 39 protein [Pirellulales bacterium]|nr:glycosyltransferase family 39 protein [Pirellulales bacterium]
MKQIVKSLNVWGSLLENPGTARKAVLSLLLTHTCLLAYSAHVHSPTLNEPGHLVAGLSHWKFGRFELYRVNPPLVRMMAALPVMAVGYEEDWSGFHEGPGARPVFGMGEDFVAANGEQSFFLFTIARWACIPFSWIGGVVCYLWARDLFGKASGVMACSLWCFSPNILAHASLITADTGGTALGIAACYTFWRWLKKPTWMQATLTGCVLGLAELAKTTLILFYPLYPLLWIVYRWSNRRNMFRQDWLREAGMLLMRMVIGLYVLNMGYGFEGSLQQLKKLHFVSDLLTGNSEVIQKPEAEEEREISATKSTNRFADTWLGNLPAPFPKNYLLGIDIQQRDFEKYGRPSYLRGQWQDHGWWYYYIYAAAIKVPLGIWALGLLTLAYRWRNREPVQNAYDMWILLVPAVVIFVVVSAKNGFSEHFRYVLPTFPFLFVYISSVVKSHRALIPAALFGAWMVASSTWVYPHSISYFNETIGGPLNGHKHLLGSCVDWGQDLCYLKQWMDSTNEKSRIENVYLAYYGDFRPADVGFSGALPWQNSDSDPNGDPPGGDDNLCATSYAASVNLLHGLPYVAKDGVAEPTRLNLETVKQIGGNTPNFRAGYSIWVFKGDILVPR